MDHKQTFKIQDELTKDIDITIDDAIKELDTVLDSMTYRDIEESKAEIQQAMKTIGREYSTYAAYLAKEAYEETRKDQISGEYEAEPYNGWNEEVDESINKNVSYNIHEIIEAQEVNKSIVLASLAAGAILGITELADEEQPKATLDYARKVDRQETKEAQLITYEARQSFNQTMHDTIDYRIKYAAGETTLQNGLKDPAKPRYARVPGGGETCTFCKMLASRGFVYLTRDTAGEFKHYHPNCKCRIVPGFNKKTTIPGYDPDALREEWKTEEREKLQRKEDREQAARAKREDKKRKANAAAKAAGEKIPYHMRTVYDDRVLQAMDRQELLDRGRTAATHQAYITKIGKREALKRYETLAPYNTDEQLRKYVKAWGVRSDKPTPKK